MSKTIYLRGLRQADHTVFCVADGQKFYYDPQFNQKMPFSSGQQVKRSIMDALAEALGEPRAPITFNYEITAKKGEEKLENKEPWSPCDPRHADQLIGGWMRARSGSVTLKRRSPLSISAMRPLHPHLASMSKENLTFDRSDHPEQHPVRVLNSDGEEMAPEAINAWLTTHDRALPRRHWIPENARTSGLFVYDVAIDLERLFQVATNRHDPELDAEQVESLQADGWTSTGGGEHLVCPKDRRNALIPALVNALMTWRVTSNQARTFSPQATLALAISDNPNRIVGAIRADLDEENPARVAHPVIDTISGVEVFVSLPAKGYVPGVTASADALDAATALLIERLRAHDYEA